VSADLIVYGEEAEIIAGHMKSQGRYWALLPNSLDILDKELP